MKVYISVDGEGISGFVQGQQGSQEDLMMARRFMTKDVNAAIEGALEAGADEIVVSDSHGSGRNLLIEELREEAEVVSGRPRPLLQMEGINESFDAAFFIGYHSKKGTLRGVWDHTITSILMDVKVNGISLGETGINAGIAGHYGVPVVLVTGDDALAREAKALLGNVETVIVKEGISRYAAKLIHPAKARAMIKKAAERSLRNLSSYKPLRFETPITLEVSFWMSSMADRVQVIPGFERVNGLTVRFKAEDFLTVFRGLMAAYYIAGTIR